MAAHIDDPRVARAGRIHEFGRSLLATSEDAVHRVLRRVSDPATMASHLRVRANGLVARSSLSPGGIAGAVIGSIIGASLVAIVLAFLYFRYRRKLQLLEKEADGSKSPQGERRLSFPGPDQTPGQNVQAGNIEYMPTWATGQPYNHQAAAFGQDVASQNDTVGNQASNDFYPPQQATFGDNFDYASLQPRLLTKDGQTGPTEYIPPLEGGAASYYDPNITMDSDPEQDPTPPTNQITEPYDERLRKARENRKNSKSSSIWSRLTGNAKRKRSTRVSELAMEEGAARPQPDVAMISIEGPSADSGGQNRVFATNGEIYDEPQNICDGSGLHTHADKKAKRRGPSGDTAGVVPHRLNSLHREPTDPQAPSQALRQMPTPPTDAIKAPQPTRFQSPDLPEPMEMDSASLPEGGELAVRGSHSPPRDEETMVNPMEVMRPSNAAEKAAFNDAELIRIASTSPPTSPPNNTMSPPPLTSSSPIPPLPQDAQEGYESETDESVSSEDEDEPNWNGMPLPIIEEPTASEGSTPAGQSSINPSDGRTPDTKFTPSPSPVLSNGFPAVDSSVSPLDSSGSPKPVLRCEECNRTFDQIHKLNHHKRYHDRKHVCTYPDCGKKFGTKTHLDRHINDKHEKKKGFHCTQEGCQYFKGGKSFPRKDNWRRHMQNKHNIVPNFEPEPAE